MFRSLRSRLWLTYSLVILVTLFLISGTVLFFISRDNPQASLILRNAIESIRQRPFGPNQNQNDLVKYLEQVDQDFGVRALIVNRNGEVLADSRADTEAPIINFSPQFGSQNRPIVRPYRDENGKSWLYTFRQIPQGGFLVVAVPNQPIREILTSPVTSDMFRSFIRAGVIALLFALVLAYLISRWVASPLQHMSAAAKEVAEGVGRQVTLEGPTEVRELGQSFNEMTQRLQASQQSQKDFVANVSHELKTPLTSIQGFAQAILDGTASSPESQAKSAQVIFDEAGRMHRLVVDLLDLAKLDAGTAELERGKLDLNVLLKNIGEKFIPQSKDSQVDLEIEVQPLPSFIGDGDRLAQVFTNLIDNAFKHTPPGGKITLKAFSRGEKLVVSVNDTGPGIPMDELDRIFERFYQVDKSRPGGENSRGIGLGLAIAQQIIHAHQGTMTARSQVGQGSEFIVTIPIVLPDDSTILQNQKNQKSR